MIYKNNTKCSLRQYPPKGVPKGEPSGKGLTLVEIIIALAMMGIIFAAIVPLFGQIRNSWDSKQAAAETLQNGRILIDHMNNNLSKAARITAVSDPSQTVGYIEFMDNDANDLRYDVNSTTGYVDAGGTFHGLGPHKHVFTGAANTGRTAFDQDIDPPMVIRYSAGARRITFRVDANDATCQITVGWHGVWLNE